MKFIYYLFTNDYQTHELFVHLSGVRDGLCQTLFISPLAPMHFCMFAMHPNFPLFDIIPQSRALLCVGYGPRSAFVGLSPMPCILNGPNQHLLDIRLSYEFSLSKLPRLYQTFL